MRSRRRYRAPAPAPRLRPGRAPASGPAEIVASQSGRARAPVRCRDQPRRPDRPASCRGNGRSAPICHRSSAGRMVFSTWSARAAANSSASDSGAQRTSSPVSSSSRIASAPSLPPGSRVTTHSMPRSRQRGLERLQLGRLADPFPAFEGDEAPRLRSRHAEELLEADPDAAEEAGLPDRFAGDQRHHLLAIGHRRRPGRRHAGPWRSAPSTGP